MNCSARECALNALMSCHDCKDMMCDTTDAYRLVLDIWDCCQEWFHAPLVQDLHIVLHIMKVERKLVT